MSRIFGDLAGKLDYWWASVKESKAFEWLIPIVLAAIILLLFVSTASAQIKELGGPPLFSWDPPTERVDGSALPNGDIRGYGLKCGTPRSLVTTIDNQPLNRSAYQGTSQQFPPGDYECVLDTRTIDGGRSVNSNAETFRVPALDLADPNAPSDVVVSWNAPPAEGDPIATFGPSMAGSIFASTADIAMATACWDIDFTFNAVTGSSQAIVSRDERAQREPGHLTVNIEPSGAIRMRLQDGTDAPDFDAVGPVLAVGQHTARACFGEGGALFEVDGALAGADPDYGVGLDGNALPLMLNQTCWNCVDATTGTPTSQLDGEVSLLIYARE